MKILCAKGPNLDFNTMLSWKENIENIDFVFWDIATRSIFDMFDEHEPDVFICGISDITRGIAKCLSENPEIKTFMYSSPYDFLDEKTIYYVDLLKKEIGKPDYIFNFVDDSSLEITLGKWKSKGYNIINIMRGANTKISKSYDTAYDSHFSLVENYNDLIAPYVYNLCDKNIKFRIYGNNWISSNCIGEVDRKNLNKVLSSSKINLCFEYNFEPPEIFFNSIICDSFPLSNTNTLKTKIPFFDCLETFDNIIESVIKHNNTNLISQAKKEILQYHTYKNRMEKLINCIESGV